MRGRHRRRGLVRSLALAIAFSTACQDAPLMPPPSRPVPSGGPLFQRYVSIGNSITAGFQSLGINDSTQLESYAVLLAQQFGLALGVDFNVPLMNSPGCPPPLVNIFTQARVAGGGAGDCALRQRPLPHAIHNVAVPGAAVIDVVGNFDPASDPNPLTTFFLGGQSQLEAVASVEPTFVTIWIGNNDVLGAITAALTTPALAGDPSLVTEPAAFAIRYSSLMAGIDAMTTIQGGVLIGVAQVVAAPFVSTGLAYFVAAQNVPTLTVLPNCLDTAPIPGGGPNDTAVVLVPFPFGAAKLDSAVAGIPVTLDCSVAEVITVPESINMIAAVAQYNGAIALEAAARGWPFLDPNPLLGALIADGSIRPFPAFPPDPDAATAPFGTALSRDGLHPSGSTHRLTANAMIAAINAAYGTTVPTLP